MSTLKTVQTEENPTEFLDCVEDVQKRKDSFELLKLFEKVTGEKPKMWGTSIIGFGKYHYKSERSTQEGDWPLVGFSPRKQNLTLYVMIGSGLFQELIKKLGKHTASKGSCLYIKKLADVDIVILEQIIKKSYEFSIKTFGKI